ncbi:hypothetical protein K432DRAFT_376793 [Lepidopterella palustris CBS 459.81]|uniref:Uncharacterized protein n=1 Tax=Lepidopterella palustris CBS 459.81 TaxID=1314670 RepID=A0A8E2JL60_9PEZI|nr:hypothetical protein K432DRAFT_376793 [Lepidopterella palustris CBS 459.81]
MSITEQHTYWKSVTSTRIIGHRGEFGFSFVSPRAILTYVKVWAKILLHENHCNLAKTPFSPSLLLRTWGHLMLSLTYS